MELIAERVLLRNFSLIIAEAIMFDYVKGRGVTTLNNDSFRREGYCSLCKRICTEIRLIKLNLFLKILLEDIFLLINVIVGSRIFSA